MDQPVHHKPRFEVIEPSMVRAQFATKRELSSVSSSFLQQQRNDKIQLRTVEESDQISIFDAAEYFSGVHDESHNHASHMQKPSSKVMLELASMARLSSVSSSIDNQSNYRARSFHATPTASSEASWNSQTGLLSNPPGSFGIKIHRFSPMSTSTNSNSKTIGTTKWQRINPKWLIPCRKCPCSGKKSVQVEGRIDSKTPRMVDLRRSYSSDDTNSSSLYSTKLKSPQKSTPTTISLPIVPLPQVQEPSNAKFGSNLINKYNKHSNGFSSSTMNPKTIVPIPLKLSTSTNTTNSTSNGSNLAKASIVGTTTSNGFTFPILEDEPISVKKMFFNVVTPQNNNQTEPNRDSLEVFQPKSHQSPRSRRLSYEEDNVSDGSSDLFEIESFSTTSYARQCDSIDEANVSGHYSSSVKRFGVVCPNSEMVIKAMSRNSLDYNEECYAPSEVSIDWSVTTAEGFDKASLSNFSISPSEIGFGGGGGGGGRKNGSGFSGGGLLSCRCEKAVSVGPRPIKCSIEGGPPIAVRHVGGGPPQQVVQGGGAGGNASGTHGNGKPSIMVARKVTK